MLCKEFFDQSEYRRHSRIEHAFKCDQESCDYHLENQLSLINHKKKVHFIEPSNSYSSNWKLECEACGKSFAKTKIEWHKTLQHPGACAKYNLDCPLRFVTEAGIERKSSAFYFVGRFIISFTQSLETWISIWTGSVLDLLQMWGIVYQPITIQQPCKKR